MVLNWFYLSVLQIDVAAASAPVTFAAVVNKFSTKALGFHTLKKIL